MGAFAPGTLIGGDYEIVRPLASGGMGEVYVARQRSTGRDRALKIMLGELAQNDALKGRFEQEARVGSQIDSEHIVEVVGAGVDPMAGAPWLAMELLEGEDLEKYLTRNGPLDVPQVLELFEQIAHGVGAAHDKMIVHRDLKPENLFLARSRRAGQRYTVKVLDFGIAKLLGQSKTASTGAMGTPLWMSPEQTQHSARIGPTADVWALGLIAFRALTGKDFWLAGADPERTAAMVLREILMDPIPFASQRSREVGGRPVPVGFDAWLARCVVRDPAARFGNAREAFRELERALHNGAVATAPGIPRSDALPSPAWQGATAFAQQSAPMPTPITYAASGPIAHAASFVSQPGLTAHPGTGAPYPQGGQGGSYVTPPPVASPPRQKKTPTLLLLGGAVALAGVAVTTVYVATRGETKKSGADVEAVVDSPRNAVPTATAKASAIPSTVSTATPAPVDPFSAGQVWKGSYICSQGPTDLRLRVQSADESRVDVVFDFSHGPTGAYGAYRMSGKYEPTTRGLRLTAGPWIRQPPGYVSVDMSGTVDEKRTVFTGKILNSSCSDFEVRLAQ